MGAITRHLASRAASAVKKKRADGRLQYIGGDTKGSTHLLFKRSGGQDPNSHQNCNFPLQHEPATVGFMAVIPSLSVVHGEGLPRGPHRVLPAPFTWTGAVATAAIHWM
ncbi:hypothetical protein D4764_01G0003420 [Takifugu flavidus]|uniref:Uncharacterized protein n=1 Tax=Takifugu flavidus TaxID=433684 RepID=A0A5C6PQB4_9TELE|nr:hypothetical protein D4764_01G0003420 [Takifugu flavidus]